MMESICPPILMGRVKVAILALGVACMSAVPMTSFAAESAATFEVPTVEHVMTVKAQIDAPIAMGATPQGQRRVINISGGTFEGTEMKGTILPGGEDWQLVRSDGATELDARYALRTEDGSVIRVHNQALVNPPAQAGGKQYVRSTVRFDAPIGTAYEWLNKAVFVGTLEVDMKQRPMVVTLRFFKVN